MRNEKPLSELVRLRRATDTFAAESIADSDLDLPQACDCGRMAADRATAVEGVARSERKNERGPLRAVASCVRPGS